MEREIKFRAWDKKNNLMRPQYGVLAKIEWSAGYKTNRIGVYEYVQTDENGNGDWDGFELEEGEFELMQFTGLKDKNGKDIYEGDIVRLLETVSEDDPAYPYYCDTMEVVYSDGWVRFGLFDGGAILNFPQNIEVIGNIYENPELQ